MVLVEALVGRFGDLILGLLPCDVFYRCRWVGAGLRLMAEGKDNRRITKERISKDALGGVFRRRA